MPDNNSPERRAPFLLVMIVVSGLIGLFLTGFGGYLALLGGSLYYVLAGLALLATAYLLYRRKASALVVYAALLTLTIIWARWEVGLDFWQLSPRGDLLVPIGILLALPWLTRRLSPAVSWRGGPGLALGVSLIFSGVVAIAALLQNPHDEAGRLRAGGLAVAANYGGVAPGDWGAYGHSWYGDKYTPLTQITPANARDLKVAWHIHTGDLKGPNDPAEFTYEVTPIKVGDTLYLCTPHNIVMALDPVSGREKWRFDPHVRVEGTQHMSCRGVSYYDAATGNAGAAVAAAKPGAPAAPAQVCMQRIFVATNDARLIALDAATGRPCPGFGNNGQLNTWAGMPFYKEGLYQFTSAPLITRGLVVLAGSIYDNISDTMPSGVVRAWDAKTGRLVWNFDPGNPTSTAPIAAGQHYSLSSPNSWSTSAADEKLGLIYLPFGMGAVDQWGGQRPPTTEKFATSIVALDAATGQVRWVYQTVHHDLWDMDVPAQPALIDLPIPGKGMVPALVQSTKTGNIFILDRRTGRPVVPVEERRVPQGAAPGDWTSPTQPFSHASFMPTERIRSTDMWGATMLDQLGCRIAFQKMRYEGPFTPPSLRPTLVYPGNFGVMDWGGMAIDPVRKIAFAHPNYMAFVDELTRTKYNKASEAARSGYNPNKGAPFAAYLNPFLSKLGLPCQAPPWGYVAGMDLTTGKVLWKHKNGTIVDTSPVPLPIKLGVPSLGGPIMTGGGVAFMSSALDYYLRAYDVTTGRELWKARLPAGAQATPMSYQGRDGRQYVVTVAGGHGSLGTKPGDDIIAYALPRHS